MKKKFLALLLLAVLCLGVIPSGAMAVPQPKDHEIIFDIDQNGTVTASGNARTEADGKIKAKAGDTVTLIVAPESGYQLKKKLEVKEEGAGGKTITCQQAEGKEYEYTFVMPDKKVKVTAEFEAIKYNVSCEPADKVSVDKPQAAKGVEVKITVEPTEGYDAAVTVTAKNGETVTVKEGNKFVMPASDVTVKVTYTAKEYNVTCETAQKGKVEADKAKAKTGDTVTLTVTPESGYQLKKLEVKEEGAGGKTITCQQAEGKEYEYTFVMPDKKVKVTAEFEAIKYNVSCEPADKVSVDKPQAAKGVEVKITVEPTEGYDAAVTVTAKNGETVTVKEGNKFVMPASDVTVKVTYTAKEYNVTCETAQKGKVEADKAKAKTGDTVTLTVTPESGYQLKKLEVKEDGHGGKGISYQQTEGKENEYTFEMPGKNVKVTAEFEAVKYNVSCEPADKVSVDKSQAAKGEEVKITVKPTEGYDAAVNVTAKSGETVTLKGDNKFVMPASDVTVKVTYTAKEYNVTCETAQKGKVEADKAKAKAGDTVTLTVTPESGHQLKTLEVKEEGRDGQLIPYQKAEGKENGYTFKMPGKNVKVTAVFEAVKYNVSCEPADKVSVDKPQAAKGEEVKITVKPTEGYDAAVNVTAKSGETVTLKGDNKFVMPASDVTVKVTYTAKEYNVTCETAQKGKVEADKAKAKTGDTVTLTVTPESGHQLKTLEVKEEGRDGQLIPYQKAEGKENEYIFVMPGKNVKVTATFVKDNTNPPQEQKKYNVLVIPEEFYTNEDNNSGNKVYVHQMDIEAGKKDACFHISDSLLELYDVTVEWSENGVTKYMTDDDFTSIKKEDAKNRTRYGFDMPASNVIVRLTPKETEEVYYTISFDANGGTGTMDDVKVKAGATYQIPACTFTPPEGKTFDFWSIVVKTRTSRYGTDNGEITNVSSDLTLVANWKDKAAGPTEPAEPEATPVPLDPEVEDAAGALPKTGDHASIALWTMLLGISGACLAMLRRRREN